MNVFLVLKGSKLFIIISDLHVSGMSFSNIFILLCKVRNVLENRDFAV